MNLTSPAAARDLLQRHNFLPAHKHGQNFLVDGNTLAKIVAAGRLCPGDTVLEVGTGLGVLTRALADSVGPTGHVVTIERDPRLYPIHTETLPRDKYANVQVVPGDALIVDIDAALIEATGDELEPISVIANIPYNITSPLIARLLDEVRHPIKVIVMLVQKEVALRLAAQPDTPDYGAFSLFAQFHCEVDIVGLVPPTVFFPRPKVTSAIIRLIPRRVMQAQDIDKAILFQVIHSAFQQRRKTLLNALSCETTGWNKETSNAVLSGAGIDAMRRGETLSLDEFLNVAHSAQMVVVR